MKATCSTPDCGRESASRGLCWECWHRATKDGCLPFRPRDRLRGDNRLFGTPEVMDRTGATFKQLDHWANIGLVVPVIGGNGMGNPRGWNTMQVDAIQALVIIARYANSNDGLSKWRPLVDLISSGAEGDYVVIVDGVPYVTSRPWEYYDPNADAIVTIRFRGEGMAA